VLDLSNAHRQIIKPFRTNLFWIWNEVPLTRAGERLRGCFNADESEKGMLPRRHVSGASGVSQKNPARPSYELTPGGTLRNATLTRYVYFMFTPGSALMAKATLVTL
jgi:hypothetical protein